LSDTIALMSTQYCIVLDVLFLVLKHWIGLLVNLAVTFQNIFSWYNSNCELVHDMYLINGTNI